MEARLKSIQSWYRIAVSFLLVGLLLRIYASPEGNPELGFPDVRRSLDTAFNNAMIGRGLHALLQVAFWATLVYLPLSAFLTKKLSKSWGKWVSELPYAGAALLMPWFEFGYSMAHSASNLIWLCTAGWLLTTILWFIQTLILTIRES